MTQASLIHWRVSPMTSELGVGCQESSFSYALLLIHAYLTINKYAPFSRYIVEYIVT